MGQFQVTEHANAAAELTTQVIAVTMSIAVQHHATLQPPSAQKGLSQVLVVCALDMLTHLDIVVKQAFNQVLYGQAIHLAPRHALQ